MGKTKLNFLAVLFLLLAVLLIVSCAKVGSPYGGPIDEDPPKVVKAVPPNKSTRFVPKKSIVITFDEYIKLEDIFNELIISPPLEDRVIAMVKGNKVVIELPKDAQFDTTTYTISFGNSITDNNEGNILENYSYVFSLKAYLDSMSVEGRVVNSFDHKPSEERFLVMLYKNLNDSAPLLERPKYIDRTDAEGYFNIEHVEITTYRLFALKDANSNLIFDLPDETIAFSDSLLELIPERFKDNVVIRDSALLAYITKGDSTSLDSVQTDSILRERSRLTYFTEMVFFTQEIKNQYITNYLRPEPEKLFLSFNQPVDTLFKITPLNYIPPDSNWFIPDFSHYQDTMAFWLTDTAMIHRDSLQFQISYPIYDSLEHLLAKTDTLYFTMTETEPSREGGRRRKGKSDDEETAKKTEEDSYIILSTNVRNRGVLDLNKPVAIDLNSPVESYRRERFKFFRLEDTVEFAQDFELTLDSNSLYRTKLYFSSEEVTDYKLMILDSAISDIYGRTNDTTIINFKTQSEDFYGVLRVHISNVHDQIIVQLLNEEEKILRQNIITNDQTLNYPYLVPKKYLLKAIIDENKNGKWDTGNYLKKIQPERVIYYDNILNVRANWEIEFYWPVEY